MTRLPPLVGQIKAWLERHDVSNEGMVIAVSGGPDSVCLWRALLALKTQKSKRPLCIAHLNHCLRGPQSGADAEFVHELHRSLLAENPDVVLRMGKADVAAQAQAERTNLEGVARRLRYEWLADVAREMGARWIATGHTADDQAETILYRLLRGTGIQGLRGIAARRPVDRALTIIRPLLGTRRVEVLDYLSHIEQPFRVDETNVQTKFTRNRIRHELLPLLAKEYNPDIASVLARLAEQAEEIFGEVACQAGKLLQTAELPRAGNVLVFDRQILAAASRPLVREAFRLLWNREGWPQSGMDFAAWERVADVALGKSPAVDFPGPVQMRCRERVIQIETRP
ncbi:MAG: tRNA lysidine(34) synthetase TilS [Gemmataceae bacterium]